MIIPIVRRFRKMNRYFIIWIFFTELLISCVQTKWPISYHETDCDSLDRETIQIDSIQTLNGYFYMEQCDKIGFSQCSGCSESFKADRGLVSLDNLSIQTNYINAYYCYSRDFYNKHDSIFQEKMNGWEIFQVYQKIDSIQKDIDTSIYLPFFHRQMKRYYRKYNRDCYRFDGHFGFKKVNLELKVIHVGVRCISMPNYNQKSRHERIFIEQKCNVYHILDIKYLGP